MLTVKENNKVKKLKSELKFDPNDDEATKWLLAYMKWYLYTNDLNTTGLN